MLRVTWIVRFMQLFIKTSQFAAVLQSVFAAEYSQRSQRQRHQPRLANATNENLVASFHLVARVQTIRYTFLFESRAATGHSRAAHFGGGGIYHKPVRISNIPHYLYSVQYVYPVLNTRGQRPQQSTLQHQPTSVCLPNT